MDRVWITPGSTTVEAMVNPIAAACQGDGIHEPFVPDTVCLLDNPGLEETIERAEDLILTVLEQHGVTNPTLRVEGVESETAFDQFVTRYREEIQQARNEEADIAVDVTPGRKFMSVIAFNAGTTFDVDHIFYFYLRSNEYYSRIYPDIPQPAAELYDFKEVLG